MVDEFGVCVGSLMKTEPWKLESRYFPSKIGGKPAWLDLKNIAIDLSCKTCTKQCIFLCQVYAPISEDERAFHRTIFIFVCRNLECSSLNKSDKFKVFRCHLPEINEFYVPEDPPIEPLTPEEWHPESTIERFSQICEVCGCLGPFRCAKCKTARYCSREHQLIDWNYEHRRLCGKNSKGCTKSPILFDENEIVFDSEFLDEEEEKEEKAEKTEFERLLELENKIKTTRNPNITSEISHLMSELALCRRDDFYKNYYNTINMIPYQAFRYEKGGQPLWPAKPNLTQEEVPHCQYCQGPRQYEFQILSTLNIYLMEKGLDWGTVLIYTCKNNCSEGPAYKEEFLWKQDIN